jgi:hypothetical protein
MAKYGGRESCRKILYWFRVPEKDMTTMEHDQHHGLFSMETHLPCDHAAGIAVKNHRQHGDQDVLPAE